VRRVLRGSLCHEWLRSRLSMTRRASKDAVIPAKAGIQ
jgi:hypothetical protein